MREERNLNIVDRALVLLSNARRRIDDGLIVLIADILFPTHLTVVDLSLDRGYGREIFLYGIARREAEVHAAFHVLYNLRRKPDRREVVAGVSSDRERVAVFSNLRVREEGKAEEQK